MVALPKVRLVRATTAYLRTSRQLGLGPVWEACSTFGGDIYYLLLDGRVSRFSFKHSFVYNISELVKYFFFHWSHQAIAFRIHLHTPVSTKLATDHIYTDQ